MSNQEHNGNDEARFGSPHQPPYYGAYDPMMDEGEGSEARPAEIAARLWRRRWLIAAILIPCLAISGFLALRAEPVYTAVARLRLGVQTPRIQPFQPTDERAEPRAENTVQTQVNIFQNRTIARRVVEDVGYRPAPSSLSRMKARIIETAFGPNRSTVAVDDSMRREGSVDSFLAGLKVTPIPDTQIFEARYTSTDPEFSARALNALCDEYLKYDFESKSAAYSEARRWLQGKLGEVKTNLAGSEEALYKFTGADGSQFMTLSDGGLQYLKEMDELRLKISATEDEYAKRKADRDRLAAGGLPDDPPAGGGGTSLATQLRALLAAAEVEVDKVTQTLGPEDSGYKSAVAARDRLAGQFATEKKRLLKVANIQFKQAEEQLAALRKSYDERQQKVIDLQQKLSGYNTLKRDVDLNRDTYNNLLQKWQEVSIGQSIQPADAVVLQRAERPLTPVHTARNRILLFGALIGVVLSFGAAFLLDQFDTTIKNSDEVRRLSGLETLGHVAPCPKLRVSGKALHPGLFTHERPSSDMAESFRSLRACVEFLSGPRPPRSLLITSPAPEEGKTTIALNLATSFAQKGRSVLLIDADLQHGLLRGIFDLNQERGLSDLLESGRSDNATIEEFIMPTRIPRLSVIPGGTAIARPADLLDSREMGRVLDSLANRFDHVVIDSASFRNLADASALAHHVDRVLVVACPGRTRRAEFSKLVRMLQVVGSRVLGVVLNNSRADLEIEYFRHDGHRAFTPETEPAESDASRQSDHIAALARLDAYYDI